MKKIRFIKKILKLGNYSEVVVLPQLILKAFGWKAKQKLEIIPDFKNERIIIKDFEK